MVRFVRGEDWRRHNEGSHEEGTAVKNNSSPDWDPREPAVLRDQRFAYDELRARCPVAHSDFLNWSLFRHEDIAAVLADPATYSSVSKHLAVPNGMDEPEHIAYRRVLEPYFTPERMRAFEPACREIAGNLIDALPKGRDIEIIEAFVLPFALQTHCAFLDWSPETWIALQGWTHGNQEEGLVQDKKTGVELARQFANLVGEELRIRRRPGAQPDQNLTSNLMTSTVDGKPLSEDEIASLLRNWTAGQSTVAAGLGILLLHLVRDPHLQANLRRDPGFVPAAIEEILRVDGPLVANRRTTTRAVELGERAIGAGEQLTLMWIAANRDERAFDDPEEIHLERDQSASYLFGAGIHNCLGAPLARLEMRVALEELIARTQTLQLGSEEALRRAVYPGNGLLALPIRLH